MSRIILPLVLAVALVPGIALAQSASPQPGPAGATPAGTAPPMPRVRRNQNPYMDEMQHRMMMSQMQAVHQQMRDLHKQARASVLASLSAAHRNAVANIIGQLALSTNPDPKTAVARINATLSTSEKIAVLRVVSDTHAKARGIMQRAEAQVEGTLPPDQRARVAQMHSVMNANEMKPRHAPDAGQIVFAMATHRGDEMGGMHRMRGMFGPRTRGHGMMGPDGMGPGGMGPGGMGPGGMGPGGMRHPMAPPPPPGPAPSAS